MERIPIKPEQPSETSGTGAITCPFFLAHSAHEIHCEGIVDDSRIILRFRQACDKKRQLRIFCSDHFKNCEIYRTLMRDKYGEEEP